MSDFDEILGFCEELFNNLDSSLSPSLINTCATLVKCYDFDVEALPAPLYEAVLEKMGQDAMDTHYYLEAAYA